MGKRRSIKKTKKSQKDITDSDVDDVNTANEEDFFYDEIDKFHAHKEKLLLEDDDAEDLDVGSEEEEVLGIASDSDEENFGDDDEQEDDDDDDEESEQEGNNPDLLDSKAWGRKKSAFYGTDTLDGLEGSDREEAERAEEEEVLAIQRRLAEQIDEDDCGLELLQTPNIVHDAFIKDDVKSRVVADFSSLSKRAQWKLVKKESPELLGLIEDFKAKISELEREVLPLIQLVKSGKIPNGYGSDFINLKYRVYLAYLLNISFYLVLKTSKTSVQNHPVITRLVQYRTVINRLAPIDKKLKPEMEDLLERYSDHCFSSDPGLFVTRDSVLNVGEEESDSDDSLKKAKKGRKKIAKKRHAEFDEQLPEKSNLEDFSKSMSEKLLEDTETKEIPEEKEEEADERRAINYEMAKNKGLKQKKRKVDRNPRVKMREKYRKAKIRRRGQVREYRPELHKYSGEASGIRIGVRKSINLQ